VISGDTREAIRELFDIDGEEKEFVTAEDYLSRFNALDAGLRQCPHVLGGLRWRGGLLR
jgi:hypothetical protein